VYFGGWRADAPPRWGEHWGDDWSHRRGGWDRRERDDRMRAAPLPDYQRQYDGARYPNRDAQRPLQERNFHFRPQDVAPGRAAPELSRRVAPNMQREEASTPRARKGEPRQQPQAQPQRGQTDTGRRKDRTEDRERNDSGHRVLKTG
jgi:hypothetical protein